MSVDRIMGRGLTQLTPLYVDLVEASTPFGGLRVVQRRPQFAFQSTDELSILRDTQSLTVNGTVTSQTSTFRVNAPASGDAATLGTALRGRYEPGSVAEVGVGILMGSRATGGSVEWGPQDDDDGIFYRFDDDGLSAVVKRAGADTIDVERASWNIDKLDGNGPSGIDVGGNLLTFLQQGHVWQVTYPWYGFGTIVWAIAEQEGGASLTSGAAQKVWPVHAARVTGDTTVEDPNLPIRVTAADNADCYVGGRQFAALGEPSVNERNIGDWRWAQSVAAANISATGGTPTDSEWIPLIGIRRRTDVDWAAGIRIVTNDFEAVTNQDLIVQEFIGVTLDDGTWGEPQYSDGQSAVQVNRSATSMTFPGGTFPNQVVALDPMIAKSGNANKDARTSQTSKRTILPEGKELVLAAMVPGNSAATVSSVLDWLEIR